jgi:hypothetical protein
MWQVQGTDPDLSDASGLRGGGPQARYLVCRCLILYFSLQWYDTDKVLSQWKNFRRAKKEALEKMVEPGAN